MIRKYDKAYSKSRENEKKISKYQPIFVAIGE